MAYVGTALLKAIETADLAERIDVLEMAEESRTQAGPTSRFIVAFFKLIPA